MAGNPVREKKSYLSVYKGKIVQRVPKGTEQSIERVTKTGDTIHELHFESFSAEIKNMYVEKTDYGMQCRVVLSDMGEEYVLNIATESSVFDSFAKRVPNIKSGVYYTIKPYDFESKEGKRMIGVNLFDGKNKIDPFFTKDNPGDVPAFPTGGTEKAVKRWAIDKTEFFENLVDDYGKKMNQPVQEKRASVNVPLVKGAPKVEEEDESDLPF
jgi:hypothetical protein